MKNQKIRWPTLKISIAKKRLGKKSRFPLELNEIPNEGWLCPAFLNTVLFNQSVQNLMRIYGRSAIFGWFVRNQNAFYGQKAHFHRCVRKRQCFCQMQRLINQRAKLSVKFTAKLFWVIYIMEGDCHAHKKPDQICNWLQVIRFFNLRQSFFLPVCFAWFFLYV